MAFKVRTTKPEKGNKYYIRKENGGYSNAIKGKPTDKNCNVLANCVGYAYGRFNEIGGYGYCKYLAPVNAELFMKYKGSCKSGSTPKVGAVMVWQKGATLSGDDGAGHVAIVEKVISNDCVYTSESGYNSSKIFWNSTRNKGKNGNWGANSNYKFLGFIYNPAVKEEDTKKTCPYKQPSYSTSMTKYKKKRNEGVRWAQWYLKMLGYNPGDIDGFFGPKTDKAVRNFQTKQKLKVDGHVGPKTRKALIAAYK